MSQRSTAQHYHTDTPFCTIRKSHVTWNFAVPGPHSEEIRRCILLFLCTLGDKKSSIQSPDCLNFRRRSTLCTTLNRNLMQASNFGGTFDQLSFDIFLKFSQKMPLYLFYSMVQKNKKWQKKLKSRGPALKVNLPGGRMSWMTFIEVSKLNRCSSVTPLPISSMWFPKSWTHRTFMKKKSS